MTNLIDNSTNDDLFHVLTHRKYSSEQLYDYFLVQLPNKFKDDAEVVMYFLEKNGEIFQHIKQKFKDTWRFIFKASLTFPEVYLEINYHLWDNQQFIYKWIKYNPLMYKYFYKYHENSSMGYKMAITAMKKNPLVYEQIQQKNDALRYNQDIIDLIYPMLNNNFDRKQLYPFHKLPYKVKNNRRVIESALHFNPFFGSYLPKNIINDLTYVNELIDKYYCFTIYSLLPKINQRDRTLINKVLNIINHCNKYTDHVNNIDNDRVSLSNLIKVYMDIMSVTGYDFRYISRIFAMNVSQPYILNNIYGKFPNRIRLSKRVTNQYIETLIEYKHSHKRSDKFGSNNVSIKYIPDKFLDCDDIALKLIKLNSHNFTYLLPVLQCNLRFCKKALALNPNVYLYLDQPFKQLPMIIKHTLASFSGLQTVVNSKKSNLFENVAMNALNINNSYMNKYEFRQLIIRFPQLYKYISIKAQQDPVLINKLIQKYPWSQICAFILKSIEKNNNVFDNNDLNTKLLRNKNLNNYKFTFDVLCVKLYVISLKQKVSNNVKELMIVFIKQQIWKTEWKNPTLQHILYYNLPQYYIKLKSES
jgi:hypothetical protein